MSTSRRVFEVVLLALAVSGWIVYFAGLDPFNRYVAPPESWQYRTVDVWKDAAGIHVKPDPLRMNRSDMVRWANKSGEVFAVEFDNPHFPFNESVLTASQAAEYRTPKSDTPVGSYKYSVILGTERLDPVIRIEDNPPADGDSIP